MVAKILTQKWFWISVAVIIVALVIFFLFRKKSIAQVPLPKEDGDLDKSDQETVRDIAQRLYNDLKGWSWITGRDSSAYQDLASTSDTIFVAVYNDFNQNFSNGKGTLRSWIEKDWYWKYAESAMAIQTIYDRMDRLGLQ